MPVSLTPGIAGVVNAAPQQQDANPLQGFADQLAKAKQLQKQSAMMDLDAAMKLSEYDPETAMKIGGPALDVLHKHAKGQAGGATPNLFMEIHNQAKTTREQSANENAAKIAQLAAATKASNAQTDTASHELEVKKFYDTAEQQAADPSTPADIKQRAQSIILHRSVMNGTKLDMDSLAFEQSSPDAKQHMLDVHQFNLLQNTPRREYVDTMSEKMAGSFGGDVDKARQWASDVYDGKEPSVTPGIDPQFAKQNIALIASVSELGLPKSMAQALLAANGDASKIPGWDPSIVKTINSRLAAATEKNADSERMSAEANAKNASTNAKEVDAKMPLYAAQAKDQFAIALERTNKAMSAYKNGGQTPPEFKELLSMMNEARQKNSVANDPAFKERIKTMAGEALGLTPVQASAWFGLGSQTNWEFTGNVDNEVPKGQTGVAGTGATPSVMSRLVSPETIGGLIGISANPTGAIINSAAKDVENAYGYEKANIGSQVQGTEDYIKALAVAAAKAQNVPSLKP